MTIKFALNMENSTSRVIFLTCSKARNLRFLNPFVELGSKDFVKGSNKQDTQTLGCCSAERTGKGKPVFITVHQVNRAKKKREGHIDTS